MTQSPFIELPATAEDVAALVRDAHRASQLITVVAGGHGPWSHDASDGIRIELTELKDVRVEGTIARIGGGATWGAVAVALANVGLAISSGDTASVGVGGLTLGGGIGWMVRSWGLAADQLIGAQIVTAAGEIVETSATATPDLFWALRGGGGNFGIVTRFDFATHRISGVAYGEYVIGEDPAAVLRTTRELMRTAPRELTVTYMDVPAMDPSAPAGARIAAVWADKDIEALKSVMAPVAALAGVDATVTTPAYREILLDMPEPEGTEEAPAPPGFLGGNGLYADIDDVLIERLVAFREKYPASIVFLRSLGGAFADVAQDDTAFPARNAQWFVMVGGFDIPGLIDDDTRAAVLAHWRQIEAGRLAEYGNFADTDRPQAVPGMFTPAAFDRLREVKAKWDPQNLFRRNHNIAP